MCAIVFVLHLLISNSAREATTAIECGTGPLQAKKKPMSLATAHGVARHDMEINSNVGKMCAAEKEMIFEIYAEMKHRRPSTHYT